MFKNLTYLLNNNGLIITSTDGMKWQKQLKPKLTFNLKRFFHFKLKEVDKDNMNNIFSFQEAKILSQQLSLYFNNFDKICYFSKNP